jgi:quinol monooxygenase YgiN
MSVVVVVATLTPLPGMLQRILDAFALIAPKVHDESGCELYAAHHSATHVVIIERWSAPADLAAHAAGTPVGQLHALLHGLLAQPTDVTVLENVPFGDPLKGTIQ